MYTAPNNFQIDTFPKKSKVKRVKNTMGSECTTNIEIKNRDSCRDTTKHMDTRFEFQINGNSRTDGIRLIADAFAVTNKPAYSAAVSTEAAGAAL